MKYLIWSWHIVIFSTSVGSCWNLWIFKVILRLTLRNLHTLCFNLAVFGKFLLFFCYILLGKWILKKGFLLDCQKKGFWLEESSYEWDSNRGYENIPVSHVLAPRRWRQFLSNSSQEGRPFDQWCAIFVLSDAKRLQGYKRYYWSSITTVLFELHLILWFCFYCRYRS